MTRAICHLLSFGKVFIHISVELELAYVPDWHKLFRPNFGRIKNVEIEVVLVFLWDELDAKLPVRKSAVVDGLVQVLTMEIRILSRQFECFVPDKRMNTEFWREDEFDKGALALCVDKRVCVYTKSLHHTI